MLTSLLIAASAICYLFIPFSKRWRYFWCAVLFLFWSTLLWSSLYLNHQLANEGKQGVGILVDKVCTPKRAQSFKYKFQVNGEEYIGNGIPGAGNQDCDESQIGDQIFLTYLVKEPSISSPAKSISSDYLTALILACFLFPLLVWGNKEQTLFWKKRRKI